MTTVHTSRFLDLRALAALEQLRFATRHRIEGSYSGRHRSRQQGGAGEFVDFREYSAGEDLRRLDWKVLARTGRAYVRLYQDETNLLCTLLVDASGSMLFGGRAGPGTAGSKLDYVQYLATAFSHIIVHGQDQAGLAVVSQGLKEYLPPGGTLIHLRHLHNVLAGLPKVRKPTGMAQALRDLFQRASRRGVLVLMSDFLDDELEEVFAALRLFRHRQWEIVVLQIIHPDEERLPTGTSFHFEGLEQAAAVDCSPAEIRSLYEERFESHCAMVRTLTLAVGGDYRRVSTAVPYLETLAGFLIARTG
jgi:uncharacterized protein (DUF58 family)